VLLFTTPQAKERHVDHSTLLFPVLATLISERLAPSKPVASALPNIESVLEPAFQSLCQLANNFLGQPVNPSATHQYEQQVQERLREVGRLLVQSTYNQIEAAKVSELPKHVQFQGTLYTRLNRKTPENVSTFFGQIRLWRVGYRPTDKSAEPTIFPLTMGLGLVHGGSPALVEHACQWLAEAGMTQERTLKRLREERGCGWGVPKLRKVSAALASQMTEHRNAAQVEQLLRWLQEAGASRGRHKPLLCVGRDGVTLPLRRKGVCPFEVASTATVSVLDRRGKRLGTVYLGYTPESHQKTMSGSLTALLEDVLRRWEGALPRLGYITDAGDNEVAYCEKTLKEMVHPRTKEGLDWIRVLDYYHASQRVWSMAEALFGSGWGKSWAKKMLKWLLKPGGVNRVLHSAAAFRAQTSLGEKASSDYDQAYSYLRDRMGEMHYAEYRSVGLPLGSGVTEAACKTVYTQRLKLSGMHWKKAGAQVILDLRVLLLSGVWNDVYDRVLAGRKQPNVWGQCRSTQHEWQIAA
jgi:hypothetical protein